MGFTRECSVTVCQSISVGRSISLRRQGKAREGTFALLSINQSVSQSVRHNQQIRFTAVVVAMVAAAKGRQAASLASRDKERVCGGSRLGCFFCRCMRLSNEWQRMVHKVCTHSGDVLWRAGDRQALYNRWSVLSIRHGRPPFL